MELKDEINEVFKIEDITHEQLQDDRKEPLFLKFYKKLKSEKSSTDAYLILLTNYARSPFRELESYLRIAIGLDGDDTQLILKQCNSKFCHLLDTSRYIHT